MNANASAAPQRTRNRAMLLAIFALFFGGFVLAGILRFSGWRPEGMKNRGELLDPPGDLRGVAAQTLDGADYRWNPGERIWRIVVAAPKVCDAPCAKLATDIELVRELQAQNADRVHLLWIGPFPEGTPPEGARRSPALRMLQDAPALRASLPRLDDPKGTPVYVVDPNGFVILRYAPGSDPGDLRADLAKLLKLK
ncbi:MAG: hypothetical protein KA144_07405 [Xanthomonadaceae bacterium]|nr:hypothetical protein [Xanthomonadaceae bacterium]